MDIRKAHSQPSPLQYDLTRPNREAIKQRHPLEKPVEASADPAAQLDPEAGADAVREARDAYREQRQNRISNARAHYTEVNAPRFAQQVTNARNEYRARLDERAKNTSVPPDGADRVDISQTSKRLVDRALEVAQSNDTTRSERLAELKSLHEQGRLNSEELIARAAHRMLDRE